ncbi:methionyl-tRNA formyltransferase [bacterium]|nr:methionyl-tRNA formyltransferase [bacterium]
MRVVFVGTDELGEIALRSVAESKHDIVLVVTQPDRPKGRGRKLTPGAVRLAAGEFGFPFIQPQTIREDDSKRAIIEADPDIIVVVSYGEYIPSSIYLAPKFNSINLHPSLLPRWRGASPVRYTLLAGDETTGVTVQYLHKKLDAGDILKQMELPVDPDDDHGSLCKRLNPPGAAMLVEVLDDFEKFGNDIKAKRQNEDNVTKAPKIGKGDLWIDWSGKTVDVRNKTRAFSPKPGARSMFRDNSYKILTIDKIFHETSGKVEPGDVINLSDKGPVVACGSKAVCITKIQPPGKKPINARDFLNGYRVKVGEKFTSFDE